MNPSWQRWCDKGMGAWPASRQRNWYQGTLWKFQVSTTKYFGFDIVHRLTFSLYLPLSLSLSLSFSLSLPLALFLHDMLSLPPSSW